ncbi:FAD:protein FMN transferase [Porphyromonas levii]|uniref:FAD:protein FMN transferase n=1 Tax=Porphyromonas levii TaxID=28114 RepID=UPI001B8C2823|nr:FAD:protein FMN transferase [Porphyromonas levii]MBR8713147.1 FAD:protein FMN transferase [Porphyromonas levii]MBR8714658.1 FAD:protein FMN transferase [Porphyromonas levii]MBR8727678.1 FAD:protein FMN transferase [Porphyromonas levii]MBR8736072.1 FAD:protein FMN transferase [Porphyromonas levii]MBR8765640.1 FAD:protein FMN transferase [Porphyromonas levii]
MKYKVLLTILLTIVVLGCGHKDAQYFRESGTRFHTLYNITYQSDRELTREIDSTMSAFNASLNPFDSTTLISRVNRNETSTIDSMLKTVVLKALEVSSITDGVYDITGAPYFDIWGFGTKKGVTREATRQEIDSIAEFVGWQKLTILGDTLLKTDPRIQLNPSSLSKGYVVDLVARTLEANGVENYLVEIGGEIVAKGLNPSGKCWRLGINKPIEDNTGLVNEIVYAVDICDGEGMASSGDYRNFKIVDGQKVAHTIDVCSGLPAHQNILSATVVAPNCMEADAWATAFMALGLERSKAILAHQPQLKVCLIYIDSITGNYQTYESGIELIELED